jgi:predicted RNA-binding Zn-ribbon protein involved in translation (DUF1610 family)
MKRAVTTSDTGNMFDSFDLLWVVLAILVAVIVAFIVRAVRLTRAKLATASRHLNLSNPDVARSVVDRMRGQELPCPRCGQETFARLGTENRHTCDACGGDFEGPAHIAASPPHS